MELSHSVVDVCIICSNFEKSLRFYRDDLGFEVVLDIDVPADRAQAVGWRPGDSGRCASRLAKR